MSEQANQHQNLKERLEARLGRRRFWGLLALVLIGVSALSVRFLFAVGLGQTSLLYLLLPYGSALLIEALRPPPDPAGEHWGRDLTLSALVVFLGSSIVLGEGFICVLFFMPFYFLGLALVAVNRWFRRHAASSRLQLSFVPLLVLAASLEGTTPALSFERSNTVAHTAVVEQAPATLLQNMAEPIDLHRSRHWLLSIFPMPEVLSGQKLEPGAVHQLRIHYPRWLIANVHSGTLEMEIVQADHAGVRSRVNADSTLFANYLTLQRIDVHFQPLTATRTAVTIAIDYDRRLDPAWYFQPVTRFAIARMAEHLLKEVIDRD